MEDQGSNLWMMANAFDVIMTILAWVFLFVAYKMHSILTKLDKIRMKHQPEPRERTPMRRFEGAIDVTDYTNLEKLR